VDREEVKNMAIVYEHIRLDTEVVFYVGWGRKDSRAYEKQGRNKHWKNIVKKVGYRVNIFAKGLTIEEALEVEIAEISRIGRIDLGKGTLVNQTNGGEGLINPSKETIEIIRNSQIERFTNYENRQKTSESTKLAMKRPEVILATSKSQIERFANYENRQKTSESTKLAMKRPEVINKVLENNKRIGLLITSLKTIYKETEEKRVPQSEIEKYTKDGWKLGRRPNSKLGRKKKTNQHIY
jgi:hypothetical protein